MKVKKEIEVTLCDLCGEEQRFGLRPCSKCGTGICPECEVNFHVDIRKSQRNRELSGPMRAYSTAYIPFDFEMNYCAKCATDIVEKIQAFGFIPKKQRPTGAVAD